ncbi:MAG: YiiD C-terminal domain-containing protein [Bdellovibrionaceae bacterium]|nr:YiiD C-terminal domain-containing protein [Pseudobdellovibrionaceae bacterium]
MTVSALERLLIQNIPMAGAMGIHSLSADSMGVRIHAPLGPNRNHLEGGFGGSIFNLLVLACYSTTLFTLPEDAQEGSHVVIQSASIRYRRPVTDDMIASCRFPASSQLEKFRDGFRRKRLARLELTAELYTATNADVAAILNGQFVATHK